VKGDFEKNKDLLMNLGFWWKFGDEHDILAASVMGIINLDK
jgi:hypothetical protein